MVILDPLFFLLTPLLIILSFYLGKTKTTPAIFFSWHRFLRIPSFSFKAFLRNHLWVLRVWVLFLLILGLVRFRQISWDASREAEGVDIVLVLDASGSMLAEDFVFKNKHLNRLEVVKELSKEFVQNRPYDRIALVAFAGYAYMVSPLTLDHDWLLKSLERIRIGAIDDGTAIGSAIFVALRRLKGSQAKSKIIILLTDGVNNAGKISPSFASQLASSLGVKVYAVGVGTKGMAPYPFKDRWGRTVYRSIKVDIDEETLKNIAQKTKGKYFRATDTQSLKDIYKEIDRLEKTKFLEKEVEYKELFFIFVVLAMLFLFTGLILENTLLLRIP